MIGAETGALTVDSIPACLLTWAAMLTHSPLRWTLKICSIAALVACGSVASTETTTPDDGGAGGRDAMGAGGSAGSGGMVNTGGSAGSGGMVNTGGSSGSGGMPEAGATGGSGPGGI